MEVRTKLKREGADLDRDCKEGPFWKATYVVIDTFSY